MHQGDRGLRGGARLGRITLPPRHRRATALHFFIGLDVVQTPTELGCAQDSVNSLTSKAMARLRNQLLDPEEICSWPTDWTRRLCHDPSTTDGCSSATDAEAEPANSQPAASASLCWQPSRLRSRPSSPRLTPGYSAPNPTHSIDGTVLLDLSGRQLRDLNNTLGNGLTGEDQTAILATYILDREGRLAAWSVGQTNERELLVAIEHATE